MSYGESILMVNNLSGDAYLVVKLVPWWNPLLFKYSHGEIYLVANSPMVNDVCDKVTRVIAPGYQGAYKRWVSLDCKSDDDDNVKVS